MDIRPPQPHKQQPTRPNRPSNSAPTPPQNPTPKPQPTSLPSDLPNISKPNDLPVQPKKSKKVSKVKKLLIILGIVGLLLISAVAGGSYWYNVSQQPLSQQEQEDVYISIESGMSSAAIARLLEDEGVVRSALAFRLQTRLMGVAHQIQAGFYALSPNQSLEEVIDILTNGSTASAIIRIPSGTTLAAVVDVFSAAGFSGSEAHAALAADYDYSILADRPEGSSLEGYLFPDTYHIAANATAEELVETILANTEEKITADIIGSWSNMGLSIHEGLTLASIVHKESPVEDMPAIAGVFWNRINTGMKLQSDATVNYALGTSSLQPSIADTEFVHPYNTYRIDGLPPGPIGSPELDAILASANPSDHDWYFFLHTPDEETVFAKTFEEHDANRVRYLDGQ